MEGLAREETGRTPGDVGGCWKRRAGLAWSALVALGAPWWPWECLGGSGSTLVALGVPCQPQECPASLRSALPAPGVPCQPRSALFAPGMLCQPQECPDSPRSAQTAPGVPCQPLGCAGVGWGLQGGRGPGWHPVPHSEVCGPRGCLERNFPQEHAVTGDKVGQFWAERVDLARVSDRILPLEGGQALAEVTAPGSLAVPEAGLEGAWSTWDTGRCPCHGRGGAGGALTSLPPKPFQGSVILRSFRGESRGGHSLCARGHSHRARGHSHRVRGHSPCCPTVPVGTPPAVPPRPGHLLGFAAFPFPAAQVPSRSFSHPCPTEPRRFPVRCHISAGMGLDAVPHSRRDGAGCGATFPQGWGWMRCHIPAGMGLDACHIPAGMGLGAVPLLSPLSPLSPLSFLSPLSPLGGVSHPEPCQPRAAVAPGPRRPLPALDASPPSPSRSPRRVPVPAVPGQCQEHGTGAAVPPTQGLQCHPRTGDMAAAVPPSVPPLEW
ncbi:transcription initiation factor TFIID subunit 4-like [Serinus canaria]|uniref:transcription initiation factor TFIID subunit 4-like n=1 Tax=Serinus canaria TaxID=9135 RepID=UPI0021CCE419|nr:transcription initiation factor TFIID subunit 4-like [Serinus canaria]XP_050839716.1 transcription initiation factor TFIID subunit 4-like [Serinus canaria]XP_050839717.1 transcription initiation factor TFIID subunit 4-like [Serinus canaria]XP_050839718.1 transcription initiation factor TFIID subunit 4-like [Serinus canaria]XP_050839719.1 transcription initiation factor TFIID subunit 4-like [Serinus canaria]